MYVALFPKGFDILGSLLGSVVWCKERNDRSFPGDNRLAFKSKELLDPRRYQRGFSIAVVDGDTGTTWAREVGGRELLQLRFGLP